MSCLLSDLLNFLIFNLCFFFKPYNAPDVYPKKKPITPSKYNVVKHMQYHILYIKNKRVNQYLP